MKPDSNDMQAINDKLYYKHFSVKIKQIVILLQIWYKMEVPSSRFFQHGYEQ